MLINRKVTEVETLNRALLEFDLNAVGIEQLERRLELAIAAVVSDCDCPKLQTCISYCNQQSGT